jgi:membrane protein implicated in regulation of membrane protease activity
MEYIDWIKLEWSTISGAPFTYATTIILVVFATALITKVVLGGEAAAAKERSEYLKQRISDLEGDKATLISKLESHGEDILKIKEELSFRPKIYISESEPENPKGGDIWIKS